MRAKVNVGFEIGKELRQPQDVEGTYVGEDFGMRIGPISGRENLVHFLLGQGGILLDRASVSDKASTDEHKETARQLELPHQRERAFWDGYDSELNEPATAIIVPPYRIGTGSHNQALSDGHRFSIAYFRRLSRSEAIMTRTNVAADRDHSSRFGEARIVVRKDTLAAEKFGPDEVESKILERIKRSKDSFRHAA